MASATNWAFNFALAYFVAPAFTNIQWRTYVIFAVFCAVMSVHVFLTYPETSGRTLEEIDMVFDSAVSPWRSNQIEDRFTEEVEKQKEVNALGGKKDAAGATHEEVV